MRYLLLILVLLISCTRQNLEVYIDSIDADDLASNHVDTPDPNRLCPDIGQMLVISWNLPRSWAVREVFARVRFGNREETTLTFPLPDCRGVKVFELINDDYCNKGGFSSYIIYLYEDGEVIDTVQHSLWCEIIKLNCDAVPQPISDISE